MARPYTSWKKDQIDGVINNVDILFGPYSQGPIPEHQTYGPIFSSWPQEQEPAFETQTATSGPGSYSRSPSTSSGYSPYAGPRRSSSFAFSGESSVFSASGSSRASTNCSSYPSTHIQLNQFDRWQQQQQPRLLQQQGQTQTGSELMSVEEMIRAVPPGNLPCEFLWLNGCPQRFLHDELDRYIEHAVWDHFGGQYPTQTVCWWCEEKGFSQGHISEDNSARNFASRTAHIWAHVQEGQVSFTTDAPRPDFYLLEFLNDHRLISPDIFERECARGEGPTIQGVHPAGWRPPPPESSGGIVHSHASEERQMRRMKNK